MGSVFTNHVRHFNAASDPADKVLPALERLLRQRMRRRNLMAAPSYLGYTVSSWDAPGAFDDVVPDCYIFAIIDRLDSLRKQLRLRSNIDGVITRNVDNFLTERQRHYDPTGYAVYRNVKAAALRASATQE